MQPTDPDKFTDKAWEAIVEAQNVARRFKQQYLESEHVTVALLEQEGLAHSILKRLELDPEVMLRELTVFAQRQARVRSTGDSNLYLGHSSLPGRHPRRLGNQRGPGNLAGILSARKRTSDREQRDETSGDRR
ncbi:MAG: hypothetical protein F6K04_18375, partial [Leptolyngbya sp. SIO4C5]|nr:hypothetical protein [Leptolyngbya sp. SIO4C5]